MDGTSKRENTKSEDSGRQAGMTRVSYAEWIVTYDCVIPYSDLNVGEKVGAGSYGVVYK